MKSANTPATSTAKDSKKPASKPIKQRASATMPATMPATVPAPVVTAKAKPTPTKPASSATQNPALPTALPVSAEQRWKMINEAAYYRAEKRGFQAGMEMDDWLWAETMIDQMLDKTSTPH